MTKPDEIGHWYSDLQCKATPETGKIIDNYKGPIDVSIFRSAIDGTLWYEIAFAYTPWWEGERT